MADEKQLSEKESLQLITEMISKAKSSYHERGTGPILWGTVVFVASFTNYLQREFDFSLGFDVWLLVLGALIPQIFISIKEKKDKVVRSFEDEAVDAVWLTYALTLFGLTLYQNIVPRITNDLILAEGWQLMKHYTDGSRPDELQQPFTLSIFSIYILIYAFPTLVTGIAKKYKPMTLGALLTYGLFLLSCFTETKIDFLLGAIAAVVCWLIPGLILRNRYLQQKPSNV